MVRRKEEEPAREVTVRVAKRAPRAGRDMEEPMPKLRRPLPMRRGGGAARFLLVTLIVIVLLGAGWFAARTAVTGLDLLSSGKMGWLATLLNIKITKLVGEENGRVNILLLGVPGDPKHDGPDLTDTMILASYNTTDKFLHLFSIPRDLQVDAADNLGIMKINAVYETGQSKNSDGAGAAIRTVGDLTGLTVPYYIRIDFAGFTQLVDELGGIKVEVKKDLLDSKYPADTGTGYQTIDIKAGSYTMDGAMALKYARSRQSTSDFDRAKRQQDILLAVRAKAKDLELLTAPAKMLAISDIIKDHFSTNLNRNEMMRAMQLWADFDPAQVANLVFDDATTKVLYGGKNAAGAYVLMPLNDDYSKLKDFVANALTQTTATAASQAEEETTPLKIEVLNGTNVTGLAAKAADTLKGMGYTIVRVGNNATKGIAKTTVYGSSTVAGSAVQTLADKASGTVSTDALTLPDGVDARVVLGADYPTQ